MSKTTVKVWVKIVPDDQPNATGHWTIIEVHNSQINNYSAMKKHIRKGYHVVASSTGRPRDFHG